MVHPQESITSFKLKPADVWRDVLPEPASDLRKFLRSGVSKEKDESKEEVVGALLTHVAIMIINLKLRWRRSAVNREDDIGRHLPGHRVLA